MRLGTIVTEGLSLLSCGLNVITGGQREMTFSAASWELAAYGETEQDRARGARRVRWVNWLNGLVTGEEDHCRKAWEAHVTFWRPRVSRA